MKKRGRRPIDPELRLSKVISLPIDNATYKIVSDIANAEDRAIAYVIRRAIKFYVDGRNDRDDD